MIVLDTHIWIWWVDGSARLPKSYHAYIQEKEVQGLGVSSISCWEVAKLVEYQRLTLACPVEEWIEKAPRHVLSAQVSEQLALWGPNSIKGRIYPPASARLTASFRAACSASTTTVPARIQQWRGRPEHGRDAQSGLPERTQFQPHLESSDG
jgi:hypothetical protein